MTKLSYRIRGEAEAEIFGVFPEAVVNRCAAAGISLRRVKAVDGQTLRCTLDEKGLARLRAICLRCQCELRLLRLTGGSRDRQLLRRRFWLPLEPRRDPARALRERAAARLLLAGPADGPCAQQNALPAA